MLLGIHKAVQVNKSSPCKYRFVLCLLLLLFPCCTVVSAKEDSYKKKEADQKVYIPAKVCRECHQEIYSMWKQSMHAHAVDDPIFVATYVLSYLRTAGEAGRLCLRCHAPTTGLTRDFEQALEITKEGITCDFCHSVVDVDLSRPENPFRINPTVAKPGADWKRDRSFHDYKRPDVLGNSEFCAGCHEYTSVNGVSLIGTYSEWKTSTFSTEGIQCQDCHMPLLEGGVKDHRLSRVSAAPGHGNGPSVSTLLKNDHEKIQTRLIRVDRKGGNLSVVVELGNLAVGHKTPTGIPSRSLVLVCEVKTIPDGETMIRKKVYRKKVVDLKSREEFEDDSYLLLKESLILDDNRLMPGETRTEEFKFMIPPDKKVRIKAYLTYHYEPVLVQKTQMNIHVSGDEKEVPAVHNH